jgi:hypothetical protein
MPQPTTLPRSPFPIIILSQILTVYFKKKLLLKKERADDSGKF